MGLQRGFRLQTRTYSLLLTVSKNLTYTLWYMALASPKYPRYYTCKGKTHYPSLKTAFFIITPTYILPCVLLFTLFVAEKTLFPSLNSGTNFWSRAFWTFQMAGGSLPAFIVTWTHEAMQDRLQYVSTVNNSNGMFSYQCTWLSFHKFVFSNFRVTGKLLGGKDR